MQATPHIEVDKEGVIAETVLMPGDPLRAKFIAEKYLENPVCFNHIRNMYGYTGYYKGHRISIMGSGMGMASIGIYSYELFKFYNVKNIIRIGSSGSYRKDVKLFDVVLVDSAYSESTFGEAQCGDPSHIKYPSDYLNDKLKESAKELNCDMHIGRCHSSDVFYHEMSVTEKMRDELNCLCVEMESFSLFHNAQVTGKNAACLLTISDSLVTDEVTTALQRQTAFNNMVEIALNAATKL